VIYTKNCVVLPTGSEHAGALLAEGFTTYPLPDGSLWAFCREGAFPPYRMIASLVEIHDRAVTACEEISEDWRESFACCELTEAGTCVVLIAPASGIPTMHPSEGYSLERES
jgi:hypothetical protein